MKNIIFWYFLQFGVSTFGQSINDKIIDTAVFYGRSISPTYQKAVCTEFVIGVLGHFYELSKEDTINIRIDQARKSINDVYKQLENGNPYPKGVVHAFVVNGFGVEIFDISQAKRGDLIQFWWPNSWGHCGILESVNLDNLSSILKFCSDRQ